MARKRYDIDYVEGIEEDLAKLRAYDQARILDKIDKQLIYQPARETRNKKTLVGLVPPWDYIESAWELRVGEYRVFYDVDEKTLTVTIRAIRFKPPSKTTEDILW
jgi:mRNA-degrading endonuclease RelE of RelBE toxin-antitoxin system